MLHLWIYSSDGRGSTLSDVVSKIFQGFSETVISVLLVTMASGWKLRFSELDADDTIEIYFPVTLLVFVV